MGTGCDVIRFGELDIDFDQRVLEPRPWTVRQASWAAELLRGLPPGRVLELCAGAGQIGLLTVARAPRELVCVDANPAAGSFIEANARRAGLSHLVEVRVADVEEAVCPEERFVLVIADPPWVRSHEVAGFVEDPAEAIDGGEDGLAVALACLRVIQEHLVPGGEAILQLGDLEQADALRRQLADGPLAVGEVEDVDGRGVLVRLTARDRTDELAGHSGSDCVGSDGAPVSSTVSGEG